MATLKMSLNSSKWSYIKLLLLNCVQCIHMKHDHQHPNKNGADLPWVSGSQTARAAPTRAQIPNTGKRFNRFFVIIVVSPLPTPSYLDTANLWQWVEASDKLYQPAPPTGQTFPQTSRRWCWWCRCWPRWPRRPHFSHLGVPEMALDLNITAREWTN